MLCSCNKEDEPVEQNYIDIVTLESITDAGTVMSLRQMGDSPLLTYTTSQTMDPKDFKEHQRVAISYIPDGGKPYVSGAVKLLAATVTVGEGAPVPEATSESTGKWATSPITLGSAWRTGKYLNLYYAGFTVENPKANVLYVDKESLAFPFPDLYLVFEGDAGPIGQMYSFYMSYDISAVWDRPNVKGITIHYVDTATQTGNTATITKD